MTRSEAAKLVAVLIAAFPNSKLSPETSQIYERMLADLDYVTANAAVEQLLATSRFPPTVAEIRERCTALTVGEVRPGGDAWGDVLRAVGRWGIHRTPGLEFNFEDTIVAECVAAISWRAICDSENQQADRARFIELYDKLAHQRRRNEISGGLPAMQRLRAAQQRQLATGDAKPIAALLSPIEDA